ncbi:ammonium transporter [Leifsonia sp. AG29]|uniref:ammonium transporter n=1 Tax=Leifsonia sp. AG29 TaxID=2598860 RepID=UPI00131C6BCB|nr:ammonium transporter [Leifsonia sp. AG29]
MSAATGSQMDALLLFICGALTILAALGLALFVGGLAGRESAGRSFRAVLASGAVTIVLAMLGGYGMAAGAPLIPHLVGRPDPGLSTVAGLHPLSADPYAAARAGYVIAACVLVAAVVAVILASRLTLRALMLFVALWCVLVLFPVAYAVFALADGWAVDVLGVVDVGGALPVIAAGASAAGVVLACGRGEHAPGGIRSLPLVAVGGALLWVGWLGLVVGSEGAMDRYTPLIAINAFLASAGGALMWMLVDRVLLRRPTVASAFCGAFSGLVAITPASGVLTLGWSLLLGALAALACATLVDLAARARFGPALTICVITVAASFVGLLYIGLFAAGGGMVDSGNFDLFVAQGTAGTAVLLYAFVVSSLLALALRFTVGLTGVRYRSGRGERSRIPASTDGPVPSGTPARTQPRGRRTGTRAQGRTAADRPR